MLAGIDLGGTKIEACLFDTQLAPLARRRVATPRESFEQLLDALADQYAWLRAESGQADLPLGVGVPGITDASTGLSLAANLPSSGKPLRRALAQRLGFDVPLKNDCKCFALSEANGGAGTGYATVIGLVMGTGVGAGVCHMGRLVEGKNGLPGEVGHIGIPASTARELELPILECKCGRIGCYETLASGPGMTVLARTLVGRDLSPQQIADGARAGDPTLRGLLDAWGDLMGELLRTLQATIDPDCVVLGGGLSLIEGITEFLGGRFQRHMLRGNRTPAIVVARHGDSSGVRGAAMLTLPIPTAAGG